MALAARDLKQIDIVEQARKMGFKADKNLIRRMLRGGGIYGREDLVNYISECLDIPSPIS